MRKTFRRTLTTAIAAMVLSVGALAGAPAAAQASWKETGEFELCARGNYRVYVSFLQRGFSSTYIEPGNCWAQKLSSIGPEWIEVVGQYRYSSGLFRVGAVQINMGTSGWGFDAVGTTDDNNHWLTYW